MAFPHGNGLRMGAPQFVKATRTRSTTMAESQGWKGKWDKWKPAIGGLIVGLVLGPFVSGWAGWQVTGYTLKREVRDAVVNQQTEMCEYLARRAVENPSELKYNARRELAEKYAKFPWDDKADFTVISNCTDQLAQEADGATTPATG